MDFDLLLLDRINVIKTTNKKYDLLNKAYISFSGGKDSTILHNLIDLALPGNRIPRVYINTGIEYLDIVSYVKELAKNDDRIIIINPKMNIKDVLTKYGYPFKSKQHSHYLSIYQHSGIGKSVKRYLYPGSTTMFKCPASLLYQFTPEFNIKCSEMCCNKLKKEPAHKWAEENNKSICITGMRKGEGGQRISIGCILLSKDNQLEKFHPLLKVDSEWEDKFLERFSIKLCKLYYPPYEFKRTGCRGCPFSLDLEHQLKVMEELLPAERKQCEFIWKPVYEEYRRIKYRLKEEYHG